jgi:hypothetical protein
MIHPVGFDFNGVIFTVVEWWFYRGFLGFWGAD